MVSLTVKIALRAPTTCFLWWWVALVAVPAWAQNSTFAPAPGQAGTRAIHPDSNIIVGWATGITLDRGYLNAADTNYTLTHNQQIYNRAFAGVDTHALGHPSQHPTVSLGDGGNAVLTFKHPLANGLGPDFVVFENGFPTQGGYFLELATVWVSSDGQRFVQFPPQSITQTQTQINGFGILQPQHLHQLAGKYPAPYGTPFDLAALADSTGLDVHHITHIKIVDVVGTLDTNLRTTDANGQAINDPFPTPFAAAGFDLDAVGVIHYQAPYSTPKPQTALSLSLYPNPALASQQLHLTGLPPTAIATQVRWVSPSGQVVQTHTPKAANGQAWLKAPHIKGMYGLQIITNEAVFYQKIMVR